MNDITLTPSAVAYVKKTLVSNPEKLGIRLGVKTSGCSGLSYILELAKEIQAGDKIFETEGVKIMVDANSFIYLKGTEVDCVQEGLNEYLKFRNPNVKSACGCGESFNVDK